MVALTLLNDHVLRQLWPSWWTGKISDFTWLAFAPFLLAVLLAWLVPARLRRHEEIVGWLSFGFVGVGFALAKTIPAVHSLAKVALETLIGGQVTLIVDPTDLITLPALLIGWYIWRQASDELIQLRARKWVVLVLGALATVATSPPPVDFGVACLEKRDTQIATITREDSRDYFVSEDGGITWQQNSLEERTSYNFPPCTRTSGEWRERQEWVLTDPANHQIQYRFRPGEGVDISQDGGQTWMADFDLSEVGKEARALYHNNTHQGFGLPFTFPGPLDALIDEQSRNLILAMGHDGVLVRKPDGEWRWVTVGPYTFERLDQFDAITQILETELWFALVLGILSLPTLVQPLRNDMSCTLVSSLILGWVAWASAAILFPPVRDINSYGFDYIIPFTAIVVAGLVALSLALLTAVDVLSEKPIALLPMVVLGAVVSLLFLFPYILWTQGNIQHYPTAALFAVLLVAATVYIGQHYLKRVFQGKPLVRKRKKVEEGGEI